MTFRFGFQREFLRQNLVPLFRQPLDLPVQWRIPWIDGLAGLVPRQAALPLGPPSPGEEGLSFVLNDAAALAREVEEPTLGGPAMRVFEFQRTFLALEPGEVTLPASRLGFAWATSFQEHAFSDLSAQDRLEGFVTAPPRRVRIEPLPEGAPPGFGGAVGRLSLTASLSADQVAVGSSVRLSVRIAGDGNLESFAAPELPSGDAWHVRGRIDHWNFEGAKPGGTPSPAGPGAGERTIEYDLSPRHASVTRVPQVRFVYFDPAPPAGYRTLESESLGIRVLPGPAAQGAPAPPAGTADGVGLRRAGVVAGLLEHVGQGDARLLKLGLQEQGAFELRARQVGPALALAHDADLVVELGRARLDALPGHALVEIGDGRMSPLAETRLQGRVGRQRHLAHPAAREGSGAVANRRPLQVQVAGLGREPLERKRPAVDEAHEPLAVHQEARGQGKSAPTLHQGLLQDVEGVHGVRVRIERREGPAQVRQELGRLGAIPRFIHVDGHQAHAGPLHGCAGLGEFPQLRHAGRAPGRPQEHGERLGALGRLG
ncbi:MAG: BatD family protein [Planctomycetes bacterium]|nr:BatD family protein [Planctomycetota bacterium]